MSSTLIPVTILAGFLGSGKTTLLNYILKQPHGHRIAVIENEFGEAGIDNELLIQDQGEQIIEMNNGCICCTVRGDLVRILGELAAKRRAGEVKFDRVVIETTGLADPAPVAQTFFVDEDVMQSFMLDAIVTLVDTKHATLQLDEHHEAQEQVGFADRILLTKTDLVDAQDVQALRQRLARMNPRAKIAECRKGVAVLDDSLDPGGRCCGFWHLPSVASDVQTSAPCASRALRTAATGLTPPCACSAAEMPAAWPVAKAVPMTRSEP